MNKKIRQIFEILLEVLADRTLLFVALFLNSALYGYAIYDPDPHGWRFGTALAFSLTVFWPILRHTKRVVSATQEENQEEREAA